MVTLHVQKKLYISRVLVTNNKLFKQYHRPAHDSASEYILYLPGTHANYNTLTIGVNMYNYNTGIIKES